jgi:aspartyl-tRNA(Asn)/glutamyl-tRNA(Gln) amidotransferase subunit C
VEYKSVGMDERKAAMAEQRISLEQVRHVAKLSRLALSEEQLRKYAGQLEPILEYVAKIGQIDMREVEPMTHVLALHNVFREDVAEKSLPVEEVLKNAPEADGRFFRVPKIIGGDEDPAG